MFTAQGWIAPVNVPSTWLGACEPNVSDFRRLLALPFRHLITAHGEPVLEHAHAQLTARVAEVFENRG